MAEAATTAAPARAPGSMLAKAKPLMLARAFSALVTALIPIALGRILAPTDYGAFRQFFLVSITLYFLLLLGIPQSLFYFLPRAAPSEKRAYVGQTLLYLGAAGLVAGLFLYLCTPLLAWVGGDALVALRLPMALFCGCFLAAAPLESALTAQGRVKRAAACYVASDVARTASYLTPALLGLGVEAVVWGAAFFALVRVTLAWVILVGHSDEPLARRELSRRQLAYALPYGGAMLLAIPQQQFHQFAVSTQFDAATFAVFAVGCFNLPVVDLLYTPVSEVLMVRLGEIDREGRPRAEAAAAFREAVGKLCYFLVPIAAGLFAIAPSFLSLLYGEIYAGAAPIFRFALVSVLLACLPVEGVLRAKGRTRSLFRVYGVKLAVTVPLVLGLLAAFGPIGAMAGWVAADVISKLSLLALAARLLAPVGARGLAAVAAVLPKKELARAGGAAAAAALLALAAAGVVPLAPLAAVLLLGTGFWVLYFAALWLVGVPPMALLGTFLPRRAQAP